MATLEKKCQMSDNESMKTNKKGFTLIELLIVIGIIAVLATAIILILNPAQLFAQARDSQRISDLGSLKSAIALYLSTVTGINLGNSANCYIYQPSSGTIGANCGARHTGTNIVTASLSSDGTGWVPINFNAIPGGAPLSALPKDPRNDSTYFYSYTGNSSFGTFELNANMESTRYSRAGSDDVESTDGGNQADVYEIGNDPSLDI